MGLARPVVLAGVVNVILFCVTHRILPAKSVVPGWRGLFKLSGFTESSSSQDEKSFACRGTGVDVERQDLEKGYLEEDKELTSPRPQLDLLDDPHGPRVRIKIDNHIDNALQSGMSRDGTPTTDQSISPSSLPVTPQRPLPALVREERRNSTVSGVSEWTIIGEEWPKEVQ